MSNTLVQAANLLSQIPGDQRPQAQQLINQYIQASPEDQQRLLEAIQSLANNVPLDLTPFFRKIADPETDIEGGMVEEMIPPTQQLPAPVIDPRLLTQQTPEEQQRLRQQKVNLEALKQRLLQGQQAQGQPVQGQPVEGQPVQGQPVQGQPVQGQPVQGQPAQGQQAQREIRVGAGTYVVNLPSARIDRNLDIWSKTFKAARVKGPMNLVSQGQEPQPTPYFTGTYGVAVPPIPTEPRATYFSNQEAPQKEALLLAIPGSKINPTTGVVSLPLDFAKYYEARQPPNEITVAKAKTTAQQTVQMNRIPEIIAPVLATVNQSMVAAGYQPMGPIGAKSAPLYLGRYYDPKTNRIRTIRNPKTMSYNPTNKEQVYGYLVNAIAHKWNQVVRLIDKMEKLDDPKFEERAENQWQKKNNTLARYRKQMLGFLNKYSRGTWKPFNTATADEKLKLVTAFNAWDYKLMAETLKEVATRVLNSEQEMSDIEVRYWTKMLNIPLGIANSIALGQERLVLQNPVPMIQLKAILTSNPTKARSLVPSGNFTVPKPYASLNLPRIVKNTQQGARGVEVVDIPRTGELRQRQIAGIANSGFSNTVPLALGR